jgi:hypothetical protein
MTYIRNDEYSTERVRPRLLTNYLEQMVKFLKLQYPRHTEEQISEFVKGVIKQRAKAPEVEAIVHKGEGHSEVKVMRLDHYIRDVIKDNNLAPAGTSYLPVSKKESFLRLSIDGKIKERSAFKKLYLDFESQGMTRESQYYNQNQANAKIFNNAIAGGMKITQFILGCKAGFNAITSSGRMSVKQGYSFIERAVNGNIYLPTVDDAISYALNYSRHIQKDFPALIENNVLYIPTHEDVMRYLLSNVENYTARIDPAILGTIIAAMTDVERSYVFYAGCINNLCRFNETIVRSWINSCFLPENLDPALYADIDIKEIKSFKDDVIACVLSTNYRRLGKKPDSDGKWNSPRDAAVNNPEGLKEFIYVCRHFVTQFETFLHILKPILQIQTTFSRLTQQHRMARYTVPLSDTDSNIFSTQELIRWKRGRIDFSQEAYEMNAIVTFMLSQSLEHVFARLSAGFGAEGKDVFRISMKNEFLYPILIVTSLAKHYLAIATMQEGSLLPNPRKDIKGVGFRSSAYPKLVTKGFETFVVDLFATIEKGEPIRAASILKPISDVEQTIYNSVASRDSDYLQTVSIKLREDYADADASPYFYYELWKAVFAPSYGEMVVPNKCYKIPLKGGKKLQKNTELLESIEKNHPEIYTRLVAFMENAGSRDISYLLIPPFKGKIHPLFLEMMDIRAHISSVMAGYYHFLAALGIGTPDIRVNGLVSDFYDPSTALIE